MAIIIIEDDATSVTDSKSVLHPGSTDAETIDDIVVNPALPHSEAQQLWSVTKETRDVFTHKPGEMNLSEPLVRTKGS